MNKYELVSRIEKIAPIETQEDWDCSGWVVDNNITDVNKVMLALTITDNVFKQAQEKQCDMIISHHPLFAVPLKFRNINIYASHTPMDKAVNGTTETLIKALGFKDFLMVNDFVRVVSTDITVDELSNKLYRISKNLRIINNDGIDKIKKIAFCAGSGSEFIETTDADAFVTGDVKYHTAVESSKVIFDIGHFESEILILNVFKDILGIEVEFSNEKTPFTQYSI